MLTVISDKSYVCSVQLIQGFDKDGDSKAMQAVRQWHLEAARKDGRPVSCCRGHQGKFLTERER
jgi:hypothetical protein